MYNNAEDVTRTNRRVILTCGSNIFNGEVDGYIQEENAIIEVKCSTSYDLPYMKRDRDGNWVLLDSRDGYFCQVQGYMQAAEKELCYFVVRLPNGDIRTAKVKRNRDFYNEMEKRLKDYR